MSVPVEQYSEREAPRQRLSLIATPWSLVYQANHGSADQVNTARKLLVERYAGAVRRYLRRLLSRADAVDDVFQEFTLQLVHGHLRCANPERGRFRNFVKGTLFHLIADYYNGERRWPGPLPPDADALVASSESVESDRRFLESWCDELLARAWAALRATEENTRQPLYTVLRFRADHPEVRSPQMARELSARLNRAFTPAGVRQVLHRAREKFADFLLDEVAHSLAEPTLAELEQELIELGLFEYCRPALERHRS
jgi:RNA polymerase sigma-70 factor (ECF subfamily)